MFETLIDNKMKRVKFITVLLLCFCIFGCKDKIFEEDNNVYGNVQVGEKVPDFSVTMSDGTKVSNQDLIGYNSLIMFFNVECGDCKKELPIVNTFYKEHQNDADFKVVCISREQTQLESIPKFWQENNLVLPYSPQDTRTIYNIFAKNIIPRLYFCNKSGKVVSMFSDNTEYTYLDTEKNVALSGTLAQKMASVNDLNNALELTRNSNK